MNVYRQELRTQFRGSLGWMVALLASVVGFLALYPVLAREMNTLRVLVKSFGKLASRGLGMNVLDMAGVLGFFGFLQIYLLIIGAVQAMLSGSGLVARERRNKTADFLFAKPASRLSIYAAKLAAALTLVLLTNLLYLGTTVGMCYAVAGSERFSLAQLLLIARNMLWIQLFFVSSGFLLAVLMRRLKSGFTLSMSAVFLLFVLAMISTLLEDDTLRYLTPFRYFDGVWILTHGSYHVERFWLGIALTVTAAGGGLLIARRIDLPAL